MGWGSTPNSTTDAINLFLSATYLLLAISANVFLMRRRDRHVRACRSTSRPGSRPLTPRAQVASQQAATTRRLPTNATAVTPARVARLSVSLRNDSMELSPGYHAINGSLSGSLNTSKEALLSSRAIATRYVGAEDPIEAQEQQEQPPHRSLDISAGLEPVKWGRDPVLLFYILIIVFGIGRAVSTLTLTVLSDSVVQQVGDYREIVDMMFYPITMIYYAVLIVLVHRFCLPAAELRGISRQTMNRYLLVALGIACVWFAASVIINLWMTRLGDRWLVVEYASATMEFALFVVFAALAGKLPPLLLQFGELLIDRARQVRKVATAMAICALVRLVFILMQDTINREVDALIFLINWPTDFIPMCLTLRYLGAPSSVIPK